MNTKHTPGEWRYSEEYKLVTTSRIGIIEGSKTICELPTFGHKPEEETNANGLLIAAAPDLLEALQQLVNTDKNNADHFHRAICDAERAIRKATTPTDHKQ